MNEIARWTTPAITYKPSMAQVADVDEIYLVIKQNGCEVIRKSKEDAVITENGFTWAFSQEDTASLKLKVPSVVQIDYTSGTARYTIYPRRYNITDSAINEVI